MKKLISKILIVAILAISLTGCGEPQVINDKEIPTYGFFNQYNKYEGVEYEIIIGNVIWGIILCETIIAPVYFFGFSLWEPVGVDTGEKTVL